MKTDGCVEKQERFFHTSLQNPAGFRTVFTGSAEVNPQTTKPDRSFATKTGHFYLLPTAVLRQVGGTATARLSSYARSAEFFGECDENPFRSAPVAEPIRVSAIGKCSS